MKAFAASVSNFCAFIHASQFSSRAAKGIFIVAVAGLAFAAQSAQGQAAAPAAAAEDIALPHGQIEYLWPDGAPGAVGTEEQDKPHLEIFGASGPGMHSAVVVCPGGGYTHLAYEKEGTRIAEWLNLRGITAFVLTYRLGPRYLYPAPILDGYRSVRWVRSHAQQFNIAPDRIGMWGFSAGGHLVGIVGTHFDEGKGGAGRRIRSNERATGPTSSSALRWAYDTGQGWLSPRR